ncbi:MAG: OmpA family protein [Wenzhouxiangella sp.]|nr:MAG: OmpA family protein [Wenzhouxiangella sp.]
MTMPRLKPRWCTALLLHCSATVENPGFRGHDMLRKIALAALIAGIGLGGAAADVNEENEVRSLNQSPTLTFAGDRYRIGVGVDTEFDIIGEFMATFAESPTTAVIGEGWMGRKGAGGVKLNYHWLFSGTSEQGPDGPVYTDGRVAKLFMAADQNQNDDRKLTFGIGYERRDWFIGTYGMRALSDERLVNRAVDLSDVMVRGQIDGRDFTRIDQLERVTELFEKPYDWGVGLRAGRYYDDQLLRLQGGFDYEKGDFGNSQTTASFTMDRFFADTPHSLSLRTGWAAKRGPLVEDRNDLRATLVYGYSFGRHYRPVREFREQAVEVMPEPRYEERATATEVTLSDRATFDFDSSELRPAARETLTELVDALREGGLVGEIRVVGHTCDLGPARYNQGLSERRAKSVVDYLIGAGIGEEEIEWAGRGENEPRYPNDSEENRSRNRRVEITFVTERPTTERVRVSPEGPITEMRQVEIATEAPWIRRALRNPVEHKRVVDTYRYQEVTETVTEGETVLANEPPSANDNQFVVQTDSTDNVFDVLVNDTDPDGDALTIVSLTNPDNGQAVISGDVILYTPAAGFAGTDSFTYTVDDGFGGQDTATVSIEVERPNRPPVANDVSVSTQRTQAVDVDVLANDSDPDGDPLEIVQFDQPANGTVSLTGDLLRYQPDQLFSGEDSFTYTISDGRGGEATATVRVNVIFANRAPVAVEDEAFGPPGEPIVVDVLANDFDPDGDPIEVIGVSLLTPAPAEAVINADGTISFTISATCSGFNLFRYTISDPFGATSSATVTVRRQVEPGTEADEQCDL